MKKFLKGILILFACLSATLEVSAQRRRTTAVFDADTTRPSPGTYGITVFKGQPYLVPNSGRAERIETSPLFIKAMSYGTVTTTATLPYDYDHITICRDSTLVVLPHKDSVEEGKRYYITFMGLRGYTADTVLQWLPWDAVFYLPFSDTVFHKTGMHPYTTTYFTQYLTNKVTGGSWVNPVFFRIENNWSVYLELLENRWYLFFADIKF